MYDMYHWDRPAPAAEDAGETSRARANRPAAANGRARGGHPRGAKAVQIALDRRDNGGDFRDSRDL